MPLVEAFHETFHLPNRYVATTDIAPVEKELRRSLIEEEATEFREASKADNLVGRLDERHGRRLGLHDLGSG